MNVKDLAEAIEGQTRLTISDIKSRNGTDKYVYPRRVYAVLLMTEFGLSVSGTARLIGRDRTTVSGYKKNWQDWMVYDKKFASMLKSVKNQASKG